MVVDAIQALDKLSPAARTFARAVLDRPECGAQLARMAQVFRRKGKKADAAALARMARGLEPKSRTVRLLTEWLVRKEAPLWHFRLVHDARRNEAYALALQHFVKPGMTVFEIGTGSGLLAMLAVRAGAAHVYTCEIRTDVAEAARTVIAQNGMQDRITVISKGAMDVSIGTDIPKRCDLFVAEIVDNSLLGEGVLPLTEYARKNILVPNAILVPRAVSAIGSLVDSESYRQYYQVGEVMGFDLSAFNRFSPLEIDTFTGMGQPDFMSAPETIISFDLTKSEHESRIILPLRASRDGIVGGLMRWLRLDFGDDIYFENNPPERSCWDPHLHVFENAVAVQAGDYIKLDVSHDRHSLFVDQVSG